MTLLPSHASIKYSPDSFRGDVLHPKQVYLHEKMNKKSFLIYIDSLSILDELTDAQAGKLFKAIKAYHLRDLCGELRDTSLDETLDGGTGSGSGMDILTRVAFAPFKAQFERDRDKYTGISEKRRDAGRLGGLQKTANGSNPKQMLAKASKTEQTLAPLISDSDSDTKREREAGAHEDVDFGKYKDELKADEEWRRYACQISGLSVQFNAMIPDQLDNFFSWMIASGEGHTIKSLDDAKRRFVYWWQGTGLKVYNQTRKGGYNAGGKGDKEPDRPMRYGSL